MGSSQALGSRPVHAADAPGTVFAPADRPVSRRRPQKPTSFEPLGEQAHPLAVVPQALDEIAAATAKDEQMAAMRIVLQRLLHHQRKPVEPFAHVGVPCRQPHPHARRDWNHRGNSALTTRASDDASTSDPTTIRSPLLSTISIRPTWLCVATAPAAVPASATVTGKSCNGSAPPTALLLPS